MTAKSEVLTVTALSCPPVLENVSFMVHEEEMVCLLAANGEGKSTLLNAIAGLSPAASGVVNVAGQRVGMVFQDDLLFPHLTVAENIAFGLRGTPAAQAGAIVDDMAALLRLEDVTGRYPHQLSPERLLRGAIARSLACGPKLLLLDEPFVHADSQRRYQFLTELRALFRRRQVAALMATANRDAAFAFADHLVLLHAGGVAQQGCSADLYYRPADRYVADFMGNGNYLPVRIDGDRQWRSALGEHQALRPLEIEIGSEWDWLVRPQEIALALDADGPAEIVDRLFIGASHFYRVRQGEMELQVQTGNEFEPGQPVRLSIRTDWPVFFPPTQETQSPAGFGASM